MGSFEISVCIVVIFGREVYSGVVVVISVGFFVVGIVGVLSEMDENGVVVVIIVVFFFFEMVGNFVVYFLVVFEFGDE